VVFSTHSFGRRGVAALALGGLAALPIATLGGALFSAERAEAQTPKKQTLLLVSYAVTKAAYDKIIPLFEKEWKSKTGQDIDIKGSYGGSGSQTRAVIDGLEADVVGLAMASDVAKLEAKGLIQPGWEKEFPSQSVPINSTVVAFLRPGNPKTSGGARWNFLALWGSITRAGGSEAAAKSFITGVYKNAEVLPKDAREATDTFVKRRQGDVLLNWETEAVLARKSGEWTGPVKVFSPNVLTEMPIAVVDRNVDKKGTRKAAQAFAQFLYTPAAQRIFVDNGFRPVTPQGKTYAQGKFPSVKFFKVGDFGGWDAIDKKFFGRGGLWDQIFAQSR